MLMFEALKLLILYARKFIYFGRKRKQNLAAGCATCVENDVTLTAWRMIMELPLSRKIVEYEIFLNERLRTDLRKVLEQRDSLYGDIGEYLRLRNVIDKLRNECASTQHEQQRPPGERQPLKTMVDLGANFYAQARVPDPSRICVCVGFGFFVEFSLEEAEQFIAKKVAHMNEKARKMSEQASEINARIRLVLEGLRELQFGSGSQEPSDHPSHFPGPVL